MISSTALQGIEFASILFTTLTMGPAMAHVLELPNKLGLSRQAYLTVQQIYRGWQFLGVAVVAALISTVLLVLRVDGAAHTAALVAMLSIVATQIVFWTLTFPVNRQTRNWTAVPEDWVQLRNRWEYSHALSAVFNFVAVVSVTLAVLIGDQA
ncbi:MAG: DUF1772 domain-containing protein [Deltaproteobacteria bacterium]